MEPSEPDGRHGPHVFVEDLEAPVLAPGDRHHMERVLRVARGDQLTVSDGQGGWRPCRYGPTLEVMGTIEHMGRPVPAITIGFALVKGDRPEWITQKLTELGVDRIVPFAAGRSVVHWEGQRAARHHQRLVTVAREAAMQSRRCWLPEVSTCATFDALAQQPRAAMAERGGEPPSLERSFLLVGPEGGWDPSERESGLPEVALGDAVLRADTAAVVAGALLATLRAGLVRERAR